MGVYTMTKRAFSLVTFLFLTCCVAFISTIRADGLPGEYLVSSRWRELLSSHSPLTNPSLPASQDFLTARSAIAPTMQGAFLLWETGITLPISMQGTIGLSVLGENDGSIQHSSFDESLNRMVPAGDIDGNANLLMMLTYARALSERLQIGANLNYAYQSNFGTPISGLGLDLGCTYLLLRNSFNGTHRVGLSTVNLIAPSMVEGFGFSFGNPGAYSRDIRLSWRGDFMKERVESALDLDLKDLWSHRGEFLSGKHTPIEWGLGFRAGGHFLGVLQAHLQLGFDKRFLEYWGLAGGVTLPMKNYGKQVEVMYQYNIKTEGTWASSHTAYIIAEIGKGREERFGNRGENNVSLLSAVVRKVQELASPDTTDELSDLKRIKGLRIEDEEEFVRITAEEYAIHFASGSAEIPREAIGVLKEIASFLRTYPGHPVTIEGHTDSDPITGRLKETFPDNTALSKARAENVKEYFVDTEGLPASIFTIVGFGEGRPIAPNTTSRSKYKNRRVVITISK